MLLTLFYFLHSSITRKIVRRPISMFRAFSAIFLPPINRSEISDQGIRDLSSVTEYVPFQGSLQGR